MTEPILSATGLTRSYGDRTVVDDVSFAVTRGRTFGLLGPNGAGKTTTVRLLNGLISSSAGAIEVFGERLTRANADALRERIGVQTDTELYGTMTARENLTLWGEFYGLSGSRLRSRVGDVLDVMRLTDRADTLVGEFSKGMRQKIAVGRALVHQPELLYLDEPTAGLDPEATEELIAYLDDMVRSTNTTLFICTHQLHGLQSLVDDVGILIGGRMVATGSVEALIQQQWPRLTVAIESSDPQLTGEVLSRRTGMGVDADGSQVKVTVNDMAEIPAIVADLVAAGVGIRAVEPLRRSIHDLYFAIVNERRATTESEVAA